MANSWYFYLTQGIRSCYFSLPALLTGNSMVSIFIKTLSLPGKEQTVLGTKGRSMLSRVRLIGINPKTVWNKNVLLILEFSLLSLVYLRISSRAVQMSRLLYWNLIIRWMYWISVSCLQYFRHDPPPETFSRELVDQRFVRTFNSFGFLILMSFESLL